MSMNVLPRVNIIFNPCDIPQLFYCFTIESSRRGKRLKVEDFKQLGSSAFVSAFGKRCQERLLDVTQDRAEVSRQIPDIPFTECISAIKYSLHQHGSNPAKGETL